MSVTNVMETNTEQEKEAIIWAKLCVQSVKVPILEDEVKELKLKITLLEKEKLNLEEKLEKIKKGEVKSG